jgi:hypothetical protein
MAPRALGLAPTVRPRPCGPNGRDDRVAVGRRACPGECAWARGPAAPRVRAARRSASRRPPAAARAAAAAAQPPDAAACRRCCRCPSGASPLPRPPRPPPPPPPPPPAPPPPPPPRTHNARPAPTPPPRAHAPAAPQPQAKKVIAEPEPPPSQLQLPGWARDAPGGPLLATALAFAAGAYTLLAAASGARRARSLPDALQRLAVASAGSDGAAAALEQCELGLGRAAEVGRWGRGRRGCCWEAGFGGSAGMSDGCWCAMFEPPLPLALPYHFTPSTPFPPPSPAPPPQSPPPGGCQP